MFGLLDFAVVLAVLFLFECARVARPGELILDRGWKGHYILRKPLFYPNDRWGWILLNPLRPLGPVFGLKPRSYAFTPEGAVVLRNPGGFLTYKDCSEPRLQEDTLVVFRGGASLRFNSAAEAHGFIELLPKAVKGESRQIEEQRLDAKLVSALRAQLQSAGAFLRYLAAAQLLVCFLLFPSVSLLSTVRTGLVIAAPLAFTISLFSALFYKRAGQRLHLRRSKLDYYGNFVKLLLYPIAAIRVMDLVSYDLLEPYDPILCVATIGSKRAASRLAAKEYLNLKHRAPPDSPALQAYRGARLAALERMDQREKLGLSNLIHPPAAMDARSRSYCPHCGAQYYQQQGICTDCPEILLQPLST
jgi:hypothetical protein